jgi:hypothetical protein
MCPTVGPVHIRVMTERKRTMRPATEARRDAADARERSEKATAAAFGVLRRAIVEGTPVTRRTLAEEATFTMGIPEDEALKELDVVAQRLGIAALV